MSDKPHKHTIKPPHGESNQPCPPPLSDFLPDTFATLKRRASGAEKPLSTPWVALERHIAFWPGMYVLVGGTGSGKTQFAMQWALHVAAGGHPVVYVGLEMTPLDIITRLLGLLAGCRWSKLSHGTISPDTLEQYMALAEERLAGLPLHLTFPEGNGWAYDRLDSLVQNVTRSYEGRAPLVVLDYLQLVQPPEHTRQDMRERIRGAAIHARNVVRAHGAVVLLVSSTSRDKYPQLVKAAGEAEAAAAKDRTPPSPSSLVGVGKESGEVEYSADGQMVLIRHDEEQSKSSPRRKQPSARPKRTRYWLALSKTRAHIPSWMPLWFDGGRFEVRATGHLDPQPQATTFSDLDLEE